MQDFFIKSFLMNYCYYVLFTFSWYLLIPVDSNPVCGSNKLNRSFKTVANMEHNNLENTSEQDINPFYSENFPQRFYNGYEWSSGIGESMLVNGSEIFYGYLNTNQSQQNPKSKLAVILSNEPFLLQNLSALIGNKSSFACKPLSMKNSSDLALCCCSKDMQQKCEGVDLTFLLPIPGDNRTTTVPSAKKTSSPNSCHIRVDRNTSRGYRKAEESTLEALKRLQLTHGIFAPNELEMEKAIAKARKELPKGKKLPLWINDFKNPNLCLKMPRQRSYLIGNTKESELLDSVNDSLPLITPMKTEDTFNEGNINLKPELIANPKDFSLLTQNADTIRKQLETIRQYDILLANIRAQAQLKLVELADLEAKHHLEEVHFNNERDKNLKELNNVKDMLEEEVKLAQNLPYNNWQDSQESIDPKILNLKLNDADLFPQNDDNVAINSEFNQEAAEMNNKLLEDLENALHESINSKYRDSFIEVKPDYGKFSADNAIMKLSLLNKALSRTARKANESSYAITDKQVWTNGLNNINVNTNNKIVDYSDKTFKNLLTAKPIQPRDVIARTKIKSDSKDGRLVPIKISEMANSASNLNSKKYTIHNSNNIINQQKNKQSSKNTI
ncbi:hypothetical protein O3M35_000674 [Rhynocoris fuscipes]|uniref:Uncharacterized protein n=1 Tax=Rhynocoris fuscipes TaxID=488301 RepID=A0AAW1DPC4_9HEMI